MTDEEFDRKVDHVRGQLRRLTVAEALAVLGYCAGEQCATIPSARAEPLLVAMVAGIRGGAAELRFRKAGIREAAE